MKIIAILFLYGIHYTSAFISNDIRVAINQKATQWNSQANFRCTRFKRPKTRSLINFHLNANLNLSKDVLMLMSTFSKSSKISKDTVVNLALKTSPSAYFLALVAAGIGMPISEDALCIFSGTILPIISSNQNNGYILSHTPSQLIAALYFGVVVSDLITFLIGRILKTGVLDPLRKKFGMKNDMFLVYENEDGRESRKSRSPKSQKLLSKLEKNGDYIGFVSRFSVGLRGPLMLLAGFSNRVTFLKYFIGSAVGGIVSLSVQLLIGYSLYYKGKYSPNFKTTASKTNCMSQLWNSLTPVSMVPFVLILAVVILVFQYKIHEEPTDSSVNI